MDRARFQLALEDERTALLTEAGMDVFIQLLFLRLPSLCPARTGIFSH